MGEPVLPNLQGRQQGLTQDRQQGLQQQDQLTTDGDRVRRKKAKDQDVEMGKPAEIKAQEGQVIKAIENVLPLKLVVRKDQKGHKPLVSNLHLSRPWSNLSPKHKNPLQHQLVVIR